MRAVVQRVTEASVTVGGETVGTIGPGLVALVGVTHGDGDQAADALARKIAGLRVLAGERSVSDEPTRYQVLVVSQFTLYGDTRKGRRPTWAAAAPGPTAEPLVERVIASLRTAGVTVATGRFGADMHLALVNDGPVTVLLDT